MVMISQMSLQFWVLILTQQLMTSHLSFCGFVVEIIEKGIQAHILKAIFQNLLLEKLHFEWDGANEDQTLDGLVILWLILKNNNPTNQVGISNLKDAFDQLKLQKISNNVVVIIDRMQKNLEDIQDRGSKIHHYLRHMFRALMTCINVVSRKFMQQEKNK